MEKHKDFDFETVFKDFHTPIKEIHEKLKTTQLIIPAQAEQQARIAELSKIPCAFALIVKSDLDEMSAVPGIKYPFEAQALSDKQFCRHVHPSYLIPFLVFAKFAYELATKANLSRELLLTATYKIPIPLKLRGNTEYAWYIQKGFVLAVNENNQIISHINFYEFDRMCLTLPNGEIENRFVEASILVDNNLHEVFQGYLKQQINAYLISLFQKQYKQWKIIELLKADVKQSNHSLAANLKLTEETIKSYSKEILQKFKAHLGYQFVTLREAVESLAHSGYI